MGLVAVVGVALIMLTPAAALDPVGVFAAVGANASFALAVVLTRRFGAPHNQLATAGWQLLIAAALLTEQAPSAARPSACGPCRAVPLASAGE